MASPSYQDAKALARRLASTPEYDSESAVALQEMLYALQKVDRHVWAGWMDCRSAVNYMELYKPEFGSEEYANVMHIFTSLVDFLERKEREAVERG